MENLMMLIWWAVATYTDPTTPLWLAVVIGQPLSFLFGFAMYNMLECCAAGLLEPSFEEYSSIDRNSRDHHKWVMFNLIYLIIFFFLISTIARV